MSSTLTLLALLAFAPVAALADELPGLDLSEPAEPRANPRAEPAPADDATGIDLGDEPPAEAEAPRADAAPQLLGSPGERDAALGDRVKAVQRKGFLKRGRWELGATLPATVNDAFYQKVGAGVRLGYHLHDNFALRLRGDQLWQVRTDRVREGKIAFSSQLLASQLERQVLLDGVWSPVYGKIAWFSSRIVHFDVFLLAGFGLAWSATSKAPRDLGAHLATDVGGGLRFYPTDWLALETGLTATFYPDQPAANVPSTMQKVVAASVGVSIFYPFSFEYRHP